MNYKNAKTMTPKEAELDSWLKYCKYLHYMYSRYGIDLGGITDEEKLRMGYLRDRWELMRKRLDE